MNNVQLLERRSSGCADCVSKAGESEHIRRIKALADELHAMVERSCPTPDQVCAEVVRATEHNRTGPLERGNKPGILTGEKETQLLPNDEPLALIEDLSHHFVADRYLWVGGSAGRVIVVDENEHKILLKFVAGAPLEEVGETSGWDAVSQLVGRLATSGFIKGISGYTEHRAPTPERFARFHLTKSCQLECIHCYADSSPRVDRTGEMSTERWRALLDEYAAVGAERVLFTGGEALIHRGCIPLMKHAKELGLHVTLFSNGILVPRYLDAIHDFADQVQISLDGPDEETNDPIRGKGTYSKIVLALDLLLARGVAVRVGMTTMEQNWEAWKAKFLEFAKRYAHTPLEFRLGFGLTRYGRAADLSETLVVDETQPIADSMASFANRESGPTITRTTSGCGYFEQLVVGPDGTVYPCHLLDGRVGHIDESSMPELIAKLKNLAQLFSVDYTEGCNKCDIRYLCGGTCRVMNGKKTGSRLLTTCQPADKMRRYRNLVELFGK
jgi:radical SAM protein with 4Fe4S-binding SPASM domain